MDDNLGQPSFLPPPLPQEDNAELSGDEDEGPDWTKLKSFASSSRPSLPKRGDKEFEPAANGPTNLQTYSLNRARDAMFGALEAERGISNKSVSYAVWYSDLARAHVTQARGVLFNGMGHSVPRLVGRHSKGDESIQRVHKRTELLPEETLYLIERGSLFCWKDEPNVLLRSGDEAGAEVDGEHDVRGSPMSVQQAFAEIIGREDLTLERYHAYAYLKRLGFNVLRAKPPSPYYPTPTSAIVSSPSQPRPLVRIFTPFVNVFSRLRYWMFGKIDWWRPINFGWFSRLHDYASVYRALRIIPAGHTVPLYTPPPAPNSPIHTEPPEPPSPYKIFYHIYKPNTPFRKSAPPPPDYSLVVVNARTTLLPTIHDLTNLWSFLPETGPPAPRTRPPKPPAPSQKPKPDTPHTSHSPLSQAPPPPSPPPLSLFSRLYRRVFGYGYDPDTRIKERNPPPRSPNPFALLKGGKKTIIIGVVDNGTVGFFRFGMGAFEDVPMV